MGRLNHIVTMYLDYAEFQAKNRQTINMRQWEEKLDAFLKFNEQDLLTHRSSGGKGGQSTCREVGMINLT